MGKNNFLNAWKRLWFSIVDAGMRELYSTAGCITGLE